MKPPFFTIITPSLNCSAFLERNLDSIKVQGLPEDHIEHWIIDGGSTDGTPGFLSRQPDIFFISEKDRGLSDAVNKGIRRASGEWIIWLNADDELAPGALIQFQEAAHQYPQESIFCGAQRVFGYEGNLVGITEAWDYNLCELLGSRTSIIQASTFVRKTVYDQVGLLDESFRYAMDYEWTVRAMNRFRCRPLPFVLTHYHWRRGSIMSEGIAGQHREFLRVRRQYKRSYFELAELRIRFYLAMEPLRKHRGIRAIVRRTKSLLGCGFPQIPSLA